MVDSIRYVHNLKEQTLDIPNQNAITRDNVAVTIDGILYVRVVDPYKASYGIEDPLYAVLQLAQTTMRSEIGKITLDKTFEEVRDRERDIYTHMYTALPFLPFLAGSKPRQYSISFSRCTKNFSLKSMC